jgi:hypothetical protein
MVARLWQMRLLPEGQVQSTWRISRRSRLHPILGYSCLSGGGWATSPAGASATPARRWKVRSLLPRRVHSAAAAA